MQFPYTNRGPLPYAIRRTNLIRLRREGDLIIYSRHYVGDDGSYKEDGIEDRFDIGEKTNKVLSREIATAIHWGCCGWSAGVHQIHQLHKKVETFLESEVCLTQS